MKGGTDNQGQKGKFIIIRKVGELGQREEKAFHKGGTEECKRLTKQEVEGRDYGKAGGSITTLKKKWG